MAISTNRTDLTNDSDCGCLDRIETDDGGCICLASSLVQVIGRKYSLRLLSLIADHGIIRFNEAQFDMVRLGIGMYGFASTWHEQRQLQHVATLRTTISQIKNVPARESIGYSRTAKLTRDTLIATVAIGYADGINRKLSNGKGSMMINGKLAPIIGNVCMDMCMLDITEVPAKEGDEVIVFGADYPVTEMSKILGTIPYEVLTGISQRVKRVYYQE